jgi:ribokinase
LERDKGADERAFGAGVGRNGMITVFGSINLDLIFAVPHIPVAGETVLGPTTRLEPGGKGANQAVAAARDGASVAMAGAVGGDGLGETALSLLQASGVDLCRVRRTEATTGCAAIAVDPAGRNAIAVGSGANLLARADQVEDACLGGTVILQMEVPVDQTAALIARTRSADGRIILNLAPALALPEESLKAVDFLVVNETEAAWLAAHLGCDADAMALHRRLGRPAVLLTLGEQGVAVAAPTPEGGELWHQAALPIRAVDTTAAGDCFVGVLASRLDAGADLPSAVRAATAAAALCCMRSGSQGSLPMRAETEAMMARMA